jgi:hypothetical protein
MASLPILCRILQTPLTPPPRGRSLNPLPLVCEDGSGKHAPPSCQFRSKSHPCWLSIACIQNRVRAKSKLNGKACERPIIVTRPVHPPSQPTRKSAFQSLTIKIRGELGENEDSHAVPNNMSGSVPSAFALPTRLMSCGGKGNKFAPVGLAALIFEILPTPTPMPELALPMSWSLSSSLQLLSLW